jgi:antitoxin (DNA-binding transcriptional repressor) of toxin-antitoxin stability system
MAVSSEFRDFVLDQLRQVVPGSIRESHRVCRAAESGYNSHMKKASVSETKDRLSAILDQVKEGETFLITEHGRVVARIEPVRTSHGSDAEQAKLADLERRGLVKRGGTVPRQFFKMPRARLPKGVSALAELLREREEGW